MNRWWTRSSLRPRGGIPTDYVWAQVVRPIQVACLAAVLAPGCGIHSAASFETASKPPEKARRPDGVAVDLEGSLPPAQSRGSTQSGLVPLKEPADISHAMHSVRGFFQAVAEEDLLAVRSVLANDAQAYPFSGGTGMRADRHWERRFHKLDYTALGGEPLYRESMVEIYRYEDLDEPMAGRPIRPASMVADDVLIRVHVTRTRLGIDHVFGSEILFVLRSQGRKFSIHALYEDFAAP